MKILLNLFLLILALQVSFGQEKHKAEKIYDSGLTNCCNFGNLIDGLLQTVSVEFPKSVGYVVIYSRTQDLERALASEYQTQEHLLFRGVSKDNKVFTVRKKTDGEMRFEFWRVEAGENLPFSTQSEWDISSLSYNKPKLFYASLDDARLCGSIGEKKNFAEILLANQDLRGHIVIFEKSQKSFLKTKKEFLNEISKQYNVSQNQLRTFFVKADTSYPYYELWLVPKKKRN